MKILSTKEYNRMREAESLYYKLLYAVRRKFLNETRHQTALRYINEVESTDGIASEAMK